MPTVRKATQHDIDFVVRQATRKGGPVVSFILEKVEEHDDVYIQESTFDDPGPDYGTLFVMEGGRHVTLYSWVGY